MKNKFIYREKLIRALNSAFREVNTLQPYTAVEGASHFGTYIKLKVDR
jgi:hypothetical protein